MQARRAARELALILFSQFDKEITRYSRKDFEDIMLKSVRILSNSASEELNLTVGSLIDIKEALDTNGPVLIEVMIGKDDKVFPMVAPGGAISKAFDESDLKNK